MKKLIRFVWRLFWKVAKDTLTENGKFSVKRLGVFSGFYAAVMSSNETIVLAFLGYSASCLGIKEYFQKKE